MRQLIAIFISFALMPVLVKKKLEFGPALLITGVLLSLIAGLPVPQIGTSFIRVFTEPATIKTISVVLMIGILGNILKVYGFLDKIVEGLETLIPSKKALIMMTPAVIGVLSVPGGAYLSAPFVDTLGKDMEMPPNRRIVVNLSFRHISMFLIPFNQTMLFVSDMIPGINLYSLIGLNLGFVIIMQTVAYFVYIKSAKKTISQSGGNKGKALVDVLIFLSPVYMPVLFNAIFDIQMYQAVLLSLVWMLFICEKPRKGLIFCCVMLVVLAVLKFAVTDPAMYVYIIFAVIAAGLLFGLLKNSDSKEFIKAGIKGFNLFTAIMLIGVYYLQNIIKNLDSVMDMFRYLFLNSTGFSVLLVVAAASLLFGMSTGLNLVPIGVILPLVLSLPIDAGMKMVYTNFVYIWSFLGYYYSPLHLCQIMTIKYIECPTGKVYREHARAIPYIVVGSFLLFYLYSFIFVR